MTIVDSQKPMGLILFGALICRLALITIAFGWPIPVLAERPYVNVVVSVRAEGGLEGRIKSYMSRSLRAVDDVQLVDSNGAFAISIVATEVKSRQGETAGYALSVATTEVYQLFALNLLHNRLLKDNPNLAAVFINATPAGGILVGNMVLVADETSLQKTCESIAAQIDGDYFESFRKKRDALLRQFPQPK